MIDEDYWLGQRRWREAARRVPRYDDGDYKIVVPSGGAVVATSIPSAELAQRAANYPVVVGRNLVEVAWDEGGAQRVVANTTGDYATGDTQTVAGYETRFLVDRLRHTLWKGLAATTTYLCVNMGSGDGDDLDADALVLDGLNDSPTVTVVASGNADFSGATTVFSGAVAGALHVRLHATDMHHARFWRLQVTYGAPTAPQMAQFWLGKAIQFPFGALYDSSAAGRRRGSAVEVVAHNGVRRAVKSSAALKERVLVFRGASAHDGSFFGAQTGVQSSLLDWFENKYSLYGGIKPFWFLDRPTASPEGSGTALAYLPGDAPVYDPVALSPTATEFAMSWREQGAG